MLSISQVITFVFAADVHQDYSSISLLEEIGTFSGTAKFHNHDADGMLESSVLSDGTVEVHAVNGSQDLMANQLDTVDMIDVMGTTITEVLSNGDVVALPALSNRSIADDLRKLKAQVEQINPRQCERGTGQRGRNALGMTGEVTRTSRSCLEQERNNNKERHFKKMITVHLASKFCLASKIRGRGAELRDATAARSPLALHRV